MAKQRAHQIIEPDRACFPFPQSMIRS